MKGQAMDGALESIEARISLEGLAVDPYPAYAALRRERPVAWIPSLGMWWATRYADIRAILLNTDDFVTGTEESLLFDTFGEHMLTTEGARHEHYRDVRLNGAFMAGPLRATMRGKIEARVAMLLDGVIDFGGADLRPTLASRLPVLTMLDLFGLPDDAEPLFRRWYDAFEAALSNHGRDEAVRERARACVAAFHGYLQTQIEACRTRARPGLLNDLLTRPVEARLSDAEIRRNALIIFFGGISTVEAVTLNTLWALLNHPSFLARVRADRWLLDAAFDESVRWVSPVQSATRHAVRTCEVAGVVIPAGATVNCMLGSANRDEAVFPGGEVFDIDRPNARRHLGFATGAHHCLGRHLAREEALAAIGGLLDRTADLRLIDADAAPRGHEFRQPPMLRVEWDR